MTYLGESLKKNNCIQYRVISKKFMLSCQKTYLDVIKNFTVYRCVWSDKHLDIMLICISIHLPKHLRPFSDIGLLVWISSFNLYHRTQEYPWYIFHFFGILSKKSLKNFFMCHQWHVRYLCCPWGHTMDTKHNIEGWYYICIQLETPKKKKRMYLLISNNPQINIYFDGLAVNSIIINITIKPII